MFKPRLNGLHLVQTYLRDNGFNLQRIERIPSPVYGDDDEDPILDDDYHLVDGSEVYETGSALDVKDLDEQLTEVMLVDEHRTMSLKFRRPSRSDGIRSGLTSIGGFKCLVEPEGDTDFVTFVELNMHRIEEMASTPTKKFMSNLTNFAKAFAGKN